MADADDPPEHGAHEAGAAASDEAVGEPAAVAADADVPGQEGGEFGFPERLWRSVADHRPPGVPSTRAFRSPLRGPWLTSVFGFLLLISLPLVALTGLLDWIATAPASTSRSRATSASSTCHSSTGPPGRPGSSS